MPLVTSGKEIEAFEKVILEFRNLTNEQAYVNVFSKRMMKPVPNRQGEFFGCDQRLDMLPTVTGLVNQLPRSAQVFDVGAGAGDVVDFALKDSPYGTIVNIEEPNSILVQAYINRLKNYPNLKNGFVYEGPIQDQRSPKEPQNLILAIHMIYHLTDFTQKAINPKKDLIDMINYLYGLLAPGGSLLIIYADLLPSEQHEAVCSLGYHYFKRMFPNEHFADNLKAIYQARNDLLGLNGSIATHLKEKYPSTNPTLRSERKESHFFSDSIADMAVLAMATELCPSNKEPFDPAKIEFCFEYLSHNPEKVFLQIEQENVPQKGMWRGSEPQILSVIVKN
ncbi:MAG: class I SAM-dependent methyltransferase [Parachlamydiaceae bacterium]|nr:class I SAM-dependent methyltransferase [Parachlamydiaceae bacterium]